MKCMICGNNLPTGQNKCPACGAAATWSKGNFLFLLDAEDEQEIKRCYMILESKKAPKSEEKRHLQIQKIRMNQEKARHVQLHIFGVFAI